MNKEVFVKEILNNQSLGLLDFFLTKEKVNGKEDLAYQVLKKSQFDFDGVIADTRTYASEKLETLTGIKMHPLDVRWYDSLEIEAEKFLNDSEYAKKICELIWYTPENIFEAHRTKGSKEIFDKAKENNISLAINTSRPETFRQTTQDWFDKENIVMDPQKLYMRIPGASSEVSKCIHAQRLQEESGIIYFFEDSVEQAQFILENTDINMILLSNICVLDNYIKKGRMFRIHSDGVDTPNLRPVYDALFTQ